MSRRALVHPRFLERIPHFYASRCTLQSAIETVSGVGSRQLTWTDVAGLANIPCALGPTTIESPTGVNETKAPVMTYSTETHHIALQGYFPSITSAMRALVDGQVFDLVGVEHDSHRKTTRLRVKLVEL